MTYWVLDSGHKSCVILWTYSATIYISEVRDIRHCKMEGQVLKKLWCPWQLNIERGMWDRGPALYKHNYKYCWYTVSFI